jgi:hypothetical protein
MQPNTMLAVAGYSATAERFHVGLLALTYDGYQKCQERNFKHTSISALPAGAIVPSLAFDVISFIGDHTAWQREFYQAATLVFIAGP